MFLYVSDFGNSFPHLAHPMPLPTCSSLPCSFRQPPVPKYFLQRAHPYHIQCYCDHERPCHAPPGRPQSKIVSHTVHILGFLRVLSVMFVSNMLPYVLQILSTFPQPAHPVPLYTFLIPFLPHDQPGHEAPDCHCSLFGCHTFHNSILPLHASPSYDSQVNWTITFQIYMFRRTSFLQLYSEILI